MARDLSTPEITHLFRHSYGKIVAALINKFGSHQLESIEDAVQDALLKGMQLWSYKNVPDNPTSWLLVVAKNNMLDGLRKKQSQLAYHKKQIETNPVDLSKEVHLDGIVVDDQLRMIFACCHPKLTQESQIILTLKLVAGFSNREVTHAMLKKEEAIAKAFTRAKKKFKEEISSIEIPIEIGLSSRLNIVLRIIYLVFSEGYAASSGVVAIKKDLCFEAIRLALLLVENKYCRRPNLYALLALMCFHASRFQARTDDDGMSIDLEHQDRNLWDLELIKEGQHFLTKATEGPEKPTQYLFQALVSFEHCKARNFMQTDWHQILKFYDLQMQRAYTPLVELNRLIPLYQIHGAEKTLPLLEEYASKPMAVKKGLYYAFHAKLLTEVERLDEATSAYEMALGFVTNDIEKAHLLQKLDAVRERL